MLRLDGVPLERLVFLWGVLIQYDPPEGQRDVDTAGCAIAREYYQWH
jgi:hypothetical protein